MSLEMNEQLHSFIQSIIISNRHGVDIFPDSSNIKPVPPPVFQISVDGLQSALNEGVPLHFDLSPLDSVRDSPTRLCIPCTLPLVGFTLSDEIVNGPVSAQAHQAQIRATQREGERERTETRKIHFI